MYLSRPGFVPVSKPIQYNDGYDDEDCDEPSLRERYIRGDTSQAGDDFQFTTISNGINRLCNRLDHMALVKATSDSPIEEDLGASLQLIFSDLGYNLRLCHDIKDIGFTDELVLFPQFPWSFYHSDYAIINPAYKEAVYLIECDGKDFHSSPEQKAHDALKDQSAARCGYTTIRFSGSEIFAKVDECSKSVFDRIKQGTRGKK